MTLFALSLYTLMQLDSMIGLRQLFIINPTVHLEIPLVLEVVLYSVYYTMKLNISFVIKAVFIFPSIY